jgi:hypothetical protein
MDITDHSLLFLVGGSDGGETIERRIGAVIPGPVLKLCADSETIVKRGIGVQLQGVLHSIGFSSTLISRFLGVFFT